jgi:predicted permease
LEEEVNSESSLFVELNKPQYRLFIIGLLISSVISFLLWQIFNKLFKGKKEVKVTWEKKNK